MTLETQPNQFLRKTLTVSELNRKVRDLLEVHLPIIWIEGELSNFSRPSSGHWYFTLKDEKAQVKCAMFRGRNMLVRFKPNSGDQVKIRARVSLYEGRGDFQLIVEQLEEAGFGILQKRFNELKDKLHTEGVFSEKNKKTIPHLPQHIGIITSPTGAAVKDVISVLKRRFPSIPLTLVPSPVQGEDAPEKLIQAIERAHKFRRFDVLLLCRGGGSIEDLWAFNSEKLARAIYSAEIPIISAVGHEIDFTIADFVADVRAATPSAAAELLCPDKEEYVANLSRSVIQLQKQMAQLIRDKQTQLKHATLRLKHPGDNIIQWSLRLDRLESRLVSATKHALKHRSSSFSTIKNRLIRANPQLQILRQRTQLNTLSLLLQKNLQYLFDNKKLRFSHAVENLELVSPIATLKRGYAIAKDSRDNIIRSKTQVAKGDKIRLIISDGEIQSKVI